MFFEICDNFTKLNFKTIFFLLNDTRLRVWLSNFPALVQIRLSFPPAVNEILATGLSFPVQNSMENKDIFRKNTGSKMCDFSHEINKELLFQSVMNY